MMTGNIITDFSLLILFLPLVAFTINIFFGKRFDARRAGTTPIFKTTVLY